MGASALPGQGHVHAGAGKHISLQSWAAAHPARAVPEPVPALPQTVVLGSSLLQQHPQGPFLLRNGQAVGWITLRLALLRASSEVSTRPATPSPSGKGTLLRHSHNKSEQIKFNQIIFKMPSNSEIL